MAICATGPDSARPVLPDREGPDVRGPRARAEERLAGSAVIGDRRPGRAPVGVLVADARGENSSVSEALSGQDERDAPRSLSFLDYEFANRATWRALALHPLILEGQRDLPHSSKASFQVRHELVDPGDPDHVRWPVDVERLAAATLVGPDHFARLADRLDAPQVVVGFGRELRPDPDAAHRIALGLPFRVQVPIPRGGVLQPVQRDRSPATWWSCREPPSIHSGSIRGRSLGPRDGPERRLE